MIGRFYLNGTVIGEVTSMSTTMTQKTYTGIATCHACGAEIARWDGATVATAMRRPGWVALLYDEHHKACQTNDSSSKS